jgi:6-phosphogluconolactonase
LDLENDIARFVVAVEGIVNPTFLAPSPDSRYLFSVSEVDNYRGQHSGSVCSYLIDGSSGRLIHVSTQISHGAYPCYLCVDKTSRFVLAANYGNGSVSVFHIFIINDKLEVSAFGDVRYI